MRKIVCFAFVLISLLGIAAIDVVAADKKAEIEAVMKCPDIPFNLKPIIGVPDFEVKAAGSSADLGGGLTDMLMNALAESDCYRVVERERLQNLLAEQRMGMTGMIDSSTAASVGKILGARFLVMGIVTEFKDSTSEAGQGISFKRIVGSVGYSNAHIGLIIRIVDASTGELLVTKSVDKERRSLGVVNGARLFGVSTGGFLGKSKAINDVTEEAIIETVEILSQSRDKLIHATEANAAGTTVTKPTVKVSECPALQSISPKVMVIIPEEHLQGRPEAYAPVNSANSNSSNTAWESNRNRGLNNAASAIDIMQRLTRPPDPAGETEIIRKFLEFGFTVVDQKQMDALRSQERFINAASNPEVAAALGAEFGADIVVTGEAFSEYAQNQDGMYTCRARVEVKAIQTNSARILAAEGLHGSGLDISEVMAGKTALRNAGSQVADYLITRICTKGSNLPSATAVSEILLTNISYEQYVAFAAYLKGFAGIQDIQKSFLAKNGRYQVRHSMPLEELAELIIQKKGMGGLNLDVTGINSNKLEMILKDTKPISQAPVTKTKS